MANRGGSLARSVGLFTSLPAGAGATQLGPGDGAGALLWLPAVGAALGAAAGLPAWAIRQWAPHAELVGAVLAVAALALLTRCLHLDGLADTADGLGSRAPAERALEIMRQSDIGPFGVVAVAFVLISDIAAVGSARGGPWTPVAALAIAAATGRVAAVQAAMRGVPAARSSGFGALVAGGISARAVAAWTIGVLAGGTLVAGAAGINVVAMIVAQLVALAGAWRLRAHVGRRIGGMTGDVFGALIETATAIVLIGVALW